MTLRKKRRILAMRWALIVSALTLAAEPPAFGDDALAVRQRLGIQKGICVVLGLPNVEQPEFVTNLAQGSELLVYFQTPDCAEATAVRKAAEAAGLLGKRVFVDHGDG